jgi:hypothetical protein
LRAVWAWHKYGFLIWNYNSSIEHSSKLYETFIFYHFGPFHLIYTPPPPPLCTRSIKFEPLRKKDQSADTNTPPEIKKYLPYPSEKTPRSKGADAHNPSETAFSNPLRNSRP